MMPACPHASINNATSSLSQLHYHNFTITTREVTLKNTSGLALTKVHTVTLHTHISQSI